MIETTTWFRRPALRVREQLSGEKVICVLEDDLASRVGPDFKWSETWNGRAVEIVGLIKRDESGRITLIRAEDLIRLGEPGEFRLADVQDKNFSGGKRPHEYLRDVWGDEDG